MTTHTDPILFVDVETTGLDAHRDALLEIAVILAEPDGTELFRDETLWWSGVSVESLRLNSPIVVQDMHDKNGLWEALRNCDILNPAYVDSVLARRIKAHMSEGERIRIAGNSPRLDLDFVQMNMPKTYATLHHRFFDMTGIETFLEMHAGYVPPAKPESNHRAMGDVEACLEQYRAAVAFLAEIEGGQA